MRAFLTGGSGFIGAHVARVLREDGWEVQALVRPTSRTENLKKLQCHLITGDLREMQSLKEGMVGCDLVMHVAADYRLWSRNPEDLYKSNVDGTRNLLQAALDLKIPKVIYTSSVGTLGIPGNGAPGNEETPVALQDMIGHYKRSKFLAEREAERYFKEYNLPVVIVNPSTPVGEEDAKPTPTGKIIVDFLNNRMPAYVQTGLNLVDVRDVAIGHLLAAAKGEPGRKYILGSQNITFRGILEMLAKLTGRKAPVLQIPHSVVSVLAYIDTFIFDKILHREPHIPVEAVRMARKYMFFDSTRAVRELGFPQHPVEDALARAIKWYCDNGYVSKRAMKEIRCK
jgi:dihydroflavonol-4-reductase